MEELQRLKETYSQYSDEKLLSILKVDFEEYEDKVISVIKQILEERNIDFNNITYTPQKSKKKRQEHENDSIPILYELSQSTVNYDEVYEIRDKILTRRRIRKEHIRPWVRLWARSIDLFIWSCIFIFVFKTISPEGYNNFSSIFNGYLRNAVVYLSWVLVESILISKVGYTFGKWLLMINVTDENGNRLSFTKSALRALFVFGLGEGLRIATINLIGGIYSYSTLVNTGKTTWDNILKINVSHKTIGSIRSIIAAVLIILPILLTIVQIDIRYRNMFGLFM